MSGRRGLVVRLWVAAVLLLLHLAVSIGISAGQVFHSYAARCTPSGTEAVVPRNSNRQMLILRNVDESATILLYGVSVHAVTASDNSSQVGMFTLHTMANRGSHTTAQLTLEGPASKPAFNCVSTGINSGILQWIEIYGTGG